MKLSVIIISYNEIEYLSNAIESCLKQKTQFEFEIIVGDDGSNDGSIEVIEQYKSKYPDIIKYFVMERKNMQYVISSFRVSNVIRRGLKMAKGEYAVCLSGDDYFTCDKIFETAVNFLDNDIQKKYTAFVSNYEYVWDDGTSKKMPAIVKNRFLYWSGDYAHISCFIFRKDVYEKDMLLDNFCDDTGLQYSILSCGEYYFYNKIALAYRQRDNSIMHESDQLELSIIELLLFQDILSKNQMYRSSCARFARPIWHIFLNKSKLMNEKYEKYRINSKTYKKDYLTVFTEFKKLPVISKIKLMIEIGIMQCRYIEYGVIRRICKFFCS